MSLRLYILFVFCITFSLSEDPVPLVKKGDVTIGVIAALHRRGPEKETCGELHLETLEEVAAVEWALNTINNQSKKDYTIGLDVYDTCEDDDLAIRQTLTLLHQHLTPHELLGVILLGSRTGVEAISPALHAYSVPVVLTQTPAAHNVPPTRNIFTTAPHLEAHAQAVLAAVESHLNNEDEERSTRVGVMSSCNDATQVLKEQANKEGITLHALLDIKENHPNDIMDFITTHLGYKGTVIALLKSDELNEILRHLDEDFIRKSKIHWIISVLNGETIPGEIHLEKLRSIMSGSLVVEPHAPLLSGLVHYLKKDQNNSIIAPLLRQYSDQNCDQTESDCTLSFDEPLKISGSRATGAVKAVSSLAAGFRLVQIERCVPSDDCLHNIKTHLEKDMIKALLKLSYTTSGGVDKIRYTADGRLITSFNVFRVFPFGLHQVGEFREDTGMVWSANKNHLMWSSGNQIDSKEDENIEALAFESFNEEQTQQNQEDGIIKSLLTSHQDYVGRTWAFTVLSIACIGFLGCLYVAIYVGLRMCDGTISGSQFMGAFLLIGVMGTYVSCVSYVLPASPLTCRLRAWSHSIFLALCYALLLVKSMHLRTLVANGTSGEVSQVALYMSLVFMVGGQIILSLMAHDRSYLTFGDTPSPLVLVDRSGIRLCLPDNFATLASQCYLLILLIIGTILALFNRNIHRNHNEARWLLLASCFSTPVVFSWMIIGYLTPAYLEAPTTSVALLILASSLLLLVFVPKLRLISRQAKEFSHKKFGMTSSVSTVFNTMDTINPPAAFCDPHQLPPGAILLPAEPKKQKIVCAPLHGHRFTQNNYDPPLISSLRSSKSTSSNDIYRYNNELTPREREINARYPIYEIDLNGCYP